MKFFTSRFFISYQYITAFVGYIMMIVVGSLIGWTSVYLPQLLDSNSSIKFTTSDGSWLAVLPFIGSPIGAIMAANIVDRIGRKPCRLMVSPLNFIAWIMIAFAESKYILFGPRIILGIGDGIIFSTFPMYLAEVTYFKIRGMLCSNITVTIAIGMLLVSIIGANFTIQNTALIFSILSLLHFGLLLFMPESPYYLLMKDRKEDATNSLRKLRGYENVSEELQSMSENVYADCENKGKLWDLIKVKSNRKACYIILIMRFLQQFSGQLAITFYITIIFNESGLTLSSATSTDIHFGVLVTCSIICSLLMERVGRRPLLILPSFGSSVSLAILGGYFYLKESISIDMGTFTWIPLLTVVSFDILFSLGMASIPTALLGELFPPSVKAVALCSAYIYFSFVVTLATKFFQLMTDQFGMAMPFFVFSGSNACAMLYVIFYLPETKGKTLEEIQVYFKDSNRL